MGLLRVRRRFLSRLRVEYKSVCILSGWPWSLLSHACTSRPLLRLVLCLLNLTHRSMELGHVIRWRNAITQGRPKGRCPK